MTEPLNLDEIEPWLQQCGSCDAGLPQSCTHPEGDYRPVMLRLVEEIERLRGEDEPQNDIDGTGECCCAGCIGMGPCDLGEPCSHGCGAMTLAGGTCGSCERELLGEDDEDDES